MRGEKFAMSQQKKPKPPTIKSIRDGHNKRRVTLDNHPSQVDGMFKDAPTFEEFREILRQQREDDLRLANEEIDATIRKEDFPPLWPTLHFKERFLQSGWQPKPDLRCPRFHHR